MRGTIPRWTASSASSRGVQWAIGRPNASGGSQASARIWQTCSGLKVAGLPERDSSPKMSPITTSTAASPPSTSAANRASCRARHSRLVSRVTPTARHTTVGCFPPTSARMILARSTSCWLPVLQHCRLLSRDRDPLRRWSGHPASFASCHHVPAADHKLTPPTTAQRPPLCVHSPASIAPIRTPPIMPKMTLSARLYIRGSG